MLHRYKCYGRNCVRQALRCYAKDVRFGEDARHLLLQGVNVVANAIGCTYGPNGRNAIIERLLRSPRITKNGSIVAEHVELQDRGANVGAQLMRTAANNTNRAAGDGTSTATLLAQSIAQQGCALIRERGANASQLRAGVLQAARSVCQQLEQMSQPVELLGEVEAVARNALNGDERLAGLIGDGIHELGEMGVFLLKESKTMHDKITVTEGVSLDQGYITPHFVNDSLTGKVEFSNALLLMTLAKVQRSEQLLPALELAKSLDCPLVVIAEDVCDEALRTLVLNQQQETLSVCAIRAPSFGSEQRDIMQDLAIATGSTLLEDVAQLQHIERTDLGMAAEVVISAKQTHLLHPRGEREKIDERVNYIRELIAEAGTDEQLDKLNERLGHLICSVAVVYVGGNNEAEVAEKKDRMNDALNAIGVAILAGIVPGGGTAYLRCIDALDKLPTESPEQALGVGIVKNALRLPCATIARNAGANAEEVLHKVMLASGNFGYDAARGEYCDLMERGIVDPTNLLRTAINAAAGIASLLATTEVLITEQPANVRIPNNQVTRDLAKIFGM